MLFAHIIEATTNDDADFNSLPKYHVSNNTDIPQFTHMKKKKHVYPLSDRFPNEESLGSDLKNWTVKVELKPDKRHIHLEKKPDDNESVTQKDVCSNDNSMFASKVAEYEKKASRRALADKTKLMLQRIKEENVLKSIRDKQGKKRSNLLTRESSTVSRAIDMHNGNNVERHPPTVNAAHHHHRKRKQIPNAMEETWKMLDSALYDNKKSQQGNSDNTVSVKLHHSDKRLSTLTQIPVEQMRMEHHLSDPRLIRSQQTRNDATKQLVPLDLPLPKFWADVTLVHKSGELQNALHVSAETYQSDMQTQRPIDVIIGVGRETVDAGDCAWQDSPRSRLMELVTRSVQQLNVLDDKEFYKFSCELNKFQCKVASFISKHQATHSE